MKPRKYTKEVILKLVTENTSVRQIINVLGLKETGGNYAMFKKLIKFYEIDARHFTGQGWAKGKTKEFNKSLKNASDKLKTPDKELFSKNAAPSANGIKLRKRLIEQGKEYKCEICNNNGVWENKQLTLQVDHINGINNDNRKCNLRFLCPNCHSQTETWGNKK